MPKMTKKQAAALHHARMFVFVMRDQVYAVTPRNDVPFSDCLAMCSAETQEKHARAVQELCEMEFNLISAGRGYRNSAGQFQPY